jgi:hypothetical protein
LLRRASDGFTAEELGEVGVFFGGIAELPVEKASGRSRKPNSAVEYNVSSSAKREM